jgi:hypothetical protein
MDESMKGKSIKQNKLKCTGLLFELLVRQVTSDTLAGRPISEALNIMKKYFHASTELGKEVQLYRAFFETKSLTESKAIHFIDLVVQKRNKLDERKLAREKYALVKEIGEHYPLKEFLSSKIPNYTINASIYKTFLSEALKNDDFGIMNIQDVARAKFTLIEQLTGTATKPILQEEMAGLEEFRQQSEELRMLSYKLVIDRFNEKYSNLNDKQKGLLREYINNVTNTASLAEYVKNEIPSVKAALLEHAKNTTDKVTAIKLKEVAVQVSHLGKSSIIKDNQVTALMLAYEILKEMES